jgi:halimadienyl-diphosphate synthase
MVIAALNLVGVPTAADSLRQFERGMHFACFERERGVSLSANAHTLAALVSLPASEQTVWAGSISKLVEFLYGARCKDGFWHDKWHVSPFYATTCSVLALSQCSEPSVRSRLVPTIEWILEANSESDGGWGVGDSSTLEETAYALQALLAVPDPALSPHRARHDLVVARGRHYLRERLDECMLNHGIDLPRMWRGKELYTPARVVLSAILAAVIAPAGEGS